MARNHKQVVLANVPTTRKHLTTVSIRWLEDPKFCYTIGTARFLTLNSFLIEECKALDRCVEETKYYVHDFISTGIISALDGGVLKSDDCLDNSLKEQLKKTAAPLRPIEAVSKDSTVVDIVDPYLFPFAFGKTRTPRLVTVPPTDCVPATGQGELVKVPSDDDCIQKGRANYPNDMAWSNHHQWLPFGVRFANKGFGPSRIVSYISNVHPAEHRAFCYVTEKLMDKLIPLFNRTLADIKVSDYQDQRWHLAERGREPMILREPGSFRPPEQRTKAREWLDENGRYQDFIFVDLKREFWNTGIQMILQLRDINLNSETPGYEGEEWHIQGQNNERIFTTAHYIYSAHNLSSSEAPTLCFRRRIRPEEATLAKDYFPGPPYAEETYGVKHDDPAIQHIGDVTLRENRLVVFPNTFQTKLKPFSLADKSKPGYLRLLTLHLVDPNRRIMSTGMVPCQRRDWWAKEVRESCPRFWRLPTEIWERIVELVDGWQIHFCKTALCNLRMEEGEEMKKQFKEERDEYRKKHTYAMDDYLPWALESHAEWVFLDRESGSRS